MSAPRFTFGAPAPRGGREAAWERPGTASRCVSVPRFTCGTPALRGGREAAWERAGTASPEFSSLFTRRALRALPEVVVR
ncbi:hypothetical protein GCM10009107_10840 [Ideonella azotifigens]|uniref:Uncharacterized protein n=1 Tax=Ideonella azotifigens TaxID=513160 RepID=A0ABN1JQW7_9BURK